MSKKWFNPHQWLHARTGHMESNELQSFITRLSERVDSNILKSVFEEELIEDGYYEDIRSDDWEKTSGMQWVYRRTDTRIDVLDVIKRDENDGNCSYWIRLVEVNLADYTPEQITSEISCHGFSCMNEVRSVHGKNDIFILQNALLKTRTSFMASTDDTMILMCSRMICTWVMGSDPIGWT